MTLDPTQRESNFRDSIKKYFVDNLFTDNEIQITFDISIPAPKVQGNIPSRWVTIDFGDGNMDNISEFTLRIYCNTKHDPEGFRLAQLRDTVYNFLVDKTKTDGLARVTHYRSREVGAWTKIGSMIIIVDSESRQFKASDESKFKYFDLTLKFGSK